MCGRKSCLVNYVVASQEGCAGPIVNACLKNCVRSEVCSAVGRMVPAMLFIASADRHASNGISCVESYTVCKEIYSQGILLNFSSRK